MIDEGTIKYRCFWQDRPAVCEEEIAELNYWREQLYQLSLIGECDLGIGYGNLSIRCDNSLQLIISGTQTGGIAKLTANHYTKVIDFDWHENYVVCEGKIKASSETLTHAAIYVADPTVKAVVHVHHLPLWKRLRDRVPTTNSSCAYGTPQMAEEIIRLCQPPQIHEQNIIVMSGHEAGILSFGKDLKEASQIILNYF